MAKKRCKKKENLKNLEISELLNNEQRKKHRSDEREDVREDFQREDVEKMSREDVKNCFLCEKKTQMRNKAAKL